MRKILLFFTSTFIVSAGFSQTVSYNILDQENYHFGDVIVPSQNGYMAYKITSVKKPLFALSIDKFRFGLEINKLDDNLKFIAKQDLFNGESKLIPGQFNSFSFGNTNCLLYLDVINNKTGNIKLLTLDGSLKINENTAIDLQKENVSFDSRKLAEGRVTSFYSVISPNKKRLLVYTETEPDSKDNKLFFVTLYDENLKILVQRKLDMHDPSNKVYMHAMTTDNDGNVYIAYRQYPEDTKKFVEKVDGHKVRIYKSKLIIIKADGKEIKADIANLDNFSNNGLGLVYSPAQNKVFILGSYSLGFDEGSIGVYKSEIDVPTMKISDVVITPFSEETLEPFKQDGFTKKISGKLALHPQYTPGFYLRGDGSVDILMQYGSSEDDSRGRFTNYYAGSMFDAHFIDNRIVYARVPYNMLSPQTNIYLYSCIFSPDDKLELLYNDNDKNIEKDISNKSGKDVITKSNVCLTTIDKNGHVTRQNALEGFSTKSVGLFQKSFMISPNSVIVTLQKLSFIGMATFTFILAKVTVK